MVHNPDGGRVHIYGNVFYRAPDETWSYGGDGVIDGWINRSDLAIHNVLVYNNTFINITSDAIGGVGSTPHSGLVCKNNYFYLSDTGLPNSNWNHNYNHFQDSGGVSEPNSSQGSGDPFADYRGLNFSLRSATVAGDNAVDSQYRTDMFGRVGSQEELSNLLGRQRRLQRQIRRRRQVLHLTVC